MGTNKDLYKLRIKYPWPNARPNPSPASEKVPGWRVPQILIGANLSEKTSLVVELGSWLGQSARFILNKAPNATIICIDHWKGSPEHYEQDDSIAILPTLYEDFLAYSWDYRDRIIPVRETTLDGLRVVANHGLNPDLIYIDANHEYEAVKADLELASELFPSSMLIGDDYIGIIRGDDVDLGVRRAVNHFMYDRGLAIQTVDYGWQILR